MMYREMCKSKIHRLIVTDARIDYEGSITIDKLLLKEADILPYEKVSVVNISNGSRFETYAIEGKAKSGIACLNGAAARLGTKGDLIIVISYAQIEESKLKNWKPKIVFVDGENRVKGEGARIK